MQFTLILTLRIGAVAVFLATALYGIVSYSPFAFDMFIQPQLLPWVGEFVAWHHLWFLAAYAASIATLGPHFDLRTKGNEAPRGARWLAVAYVVVCGAVSVGLVVRPYLPLLWNDGRSLVVGLASFVPVIWLALIDHLSGRPSWLAGEGSRYQAIGEQRLFVTCAACAAYVWTVHLLRALFDPHTQPAMALWLLTGAWALTLSITMFMVVFALLALISAIATNAANPRAWEYTLTVALAAGGICELIRRLVLPTLALEGAAALAVALCAGVSLAATWSGLVWRAPRSPRVPPQAAVDLLLPSGPRSALSGLLALPVASSFALSAVERLDWMFVLQHAIVVCEWLLSFGFILCFTRHVRERTWTARVLPAALVVTLAALFAMPRAASAVAAWTGDHTLEASVSFERHAAAEVSVKLMASAITSQPGHDAEYYRYLQVHGSPNALVTIPHVELSRQPGTGPDRTPDIFMFVIDSLRRDYLSPYNRAVTFTPSIQEFADDSFVFHNAFTRHGGTELALPSLWAGALVTRRVRAPGFERMNAIEKLINSGGYRLAINDFTVAGLLRAGTPVTMIDPDVPSVDTDLCRNVEGLKTYLHGTAIDSRPVFGYFAPMNVHLLNTRRAGQESPSDRDYRGFYSPYASRLRRIDGCLGEFIAYLKAHDRYDDAIIILTSDHGDSLGENGYWGHAYWLFPEGVRIPLIVRIPPGLARNVTTDLAQIAFSTDIAPTLYALLAHDVATGPLLGAPLFVPSDGTLPSRRRESFLITSSYAATYGLLRRNGRYMYVSDLFERKEFAFDLWPEPIGKRVTVDQGFRRVNQQMIRERLADVTRFYQIRHRKP